METAGQSPPSGRCPRHAKTAAATPKLVGKWVSPGDLWGEPFRVFFPLAVLAGIVGVIVWPLVLWGRMETFPNVIHARLMIMGFMGGFVFGFLGTSIPRLLETRSLRACETLSLALIHLAVIVCYTMNRIAWGDSLVVANVGLLAVTLGRRFLQRKDLPPPGFLMILPGFACLLGGLYVAHQGRTELLEPEWELFFRLLTYHGYVLLCLLGAGSFLLPRFLGTGIRRKIAGGRDPSRQWLGAAAMALVIGFSVAGSYVLDAFHRPQLGASIRAILVTGFLCWEIPFERLRFTWRGVQWLLVAGLACLPVGIATAGWFPGVRVGMAHIELVGGFSLITMAVASRIVYGHSGNRERLERFHLWITIAAGLCVVGLLSRLTGDFMPRLMLSHYIYGALCWVVGLIIWAVVVLPKVLKPDPEG